MEKNSKRHLRQFQWFVFGGLSMELYIVFGLLKLFREANSNDRLEYGKAIAFNHWTGHNRLEIMMRGN